MDDCAHHLDLRAPNAADPLSVIKGRNLEIEFISKILNRQVTEILK